MARRCQGFFLLLMIAFSASEQTVWGQTIGGWNMSRGGTSSIDDPTSGLGFYRSLIDANFPERNLTYVSTGDLTPEFLNSVDMLLLGVVGTSTAGNISGIAPLTTAEQQALLNFVNSGKGAFLITENSDFLAASDSLLQPFGIDPVGIIGGSPTAVITNATAFPEITNGRFGQVTSAVGNFAGWYESIEPATALAHWNTNNQPAILALRDQGPGKGRVVFFADSALLPRDNAPGDDVPLFLNSVEFLIVPEPSSITLVIVGLSGLLCVIKRHHLRQRDETKAWFATEENTAAMLGGSAAKDLS